MGEYVAFHKSRSDDSCEPGVLNPRWRENNRRNKESRSDGMCDALVRSSLCRHFATGRACGGLAHNLGLTSPGYRIPSLPRLTHLLHLLTSSPTPAMTKQSSNLSVFLQIALVVIVAALLFRLLAPRNP